MFFFKRETTTSKPQLTLAARDNKILDLHPASNPPPQEAFHLIKSKDLMENDGSCRQIILDSDSSHQNCGESSKEEGESTVNKSKEVVESSLSPCAPDDDKAVDPSELQPGDHVYTWKSSFGIPYAYQRHGIILSTSPIITITSFYSNPKDPDAPAVEEIPLSDFTANPSTDIHKVKYSAGFVSRLFQRAGTVTSIPKDPPSLVKARAIFFIQNPQFIPKYHSLSCNSECLSVFCSTGSFLTLQASSFLHVSALSQAKGAMVTGGMLAGMSSTVTVPAAGFWGTLGFTTTTTVPLLATQPWIMPVLVVYGMTALLPLEMLRRWKGWWKELEEGLNKDFWRECDKEILNEFWMEKNEETVRKYFGDTNEDDREWKESINTKVIEEQEENSDSEEQKDEQIVMKLFD